MASGSHLQRPCTSHSPRVTRPACATASAAGDWEGGAVGVGGRQSVPLVYDFWGFPERYYEVEYAAPGAPELADQVRKLLHSPATPVYDDTTRGLDHGAYVPLKEMYPDAD